jgi:ABC-2 type transport system ATP-binding protein
MSAIEVTNLTKKFKDFTAVNSISFSIEHGEVFGLLGPNGAGKTTTLSMLCTILKPTDGTATINTFDITNHPNEVRKSIGIVFQDPSLDDRLTGRENLEMHARLYNVDEKVRNERINEVLRLVELEDKADHLVRTYSGGMRRRLEIARGLIHYPKILFLDEPTLGLDPQTRIHIWDYIKELAKREKITVIITTHYMDEADALCNRIAIMDHGQIIALDTSENLKNGLGGDTITLKPDDMEKAKTVFDNYQILDGEMVLFVKNAEKDMRKIFEKAEKNKITILEIKMRKPTLDDVFLKLTGREIRDAEISAKDARRFRGH